MSLTFSGLQWLKLEHCIPMCLIYPHWPLYLRKTVKLRWNFWIWPFLVSRPAGLYEQLLILNLLIWWFHWLNDQQRHLEVKKEGELRLSLMGTIDLLKFIHITNQVYYKVIILFTNRLCFVRSTWTLQLTKEWQMCNFVRFTKIYTNCSEIQTLQKLCKSFKFDGISRYFLG